MNYIGEDTTLQGGVGGCVYTEPGYRVPQPKFENIPDELKSKPQWLVWRLESRGNPPKPTKVPYSARSKSVLSKARSTDPDTWVTFERAKLFWTVHHNHADETKRVDGIGYVFSSEDDIMGIDFDNAIRDDGEIEQWATEKLEQLGGGYAEISPSGRGFKLFGRGSLPAKGKAGGRSRGGYGPDGRGKVEIFEASRYFTVTGETLDSSTHGIVPFDSTGLYLLVEEVDQKRETSVPKPSNPGPSLPMLSLSDEDLLDRARKAKNGSKFTALFDMGDTSGHNNDHSVADLALCSMLAFWTNRDQSRVESLFLRSALARRDKAQRPDYVAATVARAIDATSETYGDRPFNGNGNGNGYVVRMPQAQQRGVDEELAGLDCTDVGNANRLAARFGDVVRYCHSWKTFVIWDGRRFAIDAKGRVVEYAKATAQAILNEASTCQDGEDRKRLAKWSFDSQSASRIAAMIKLVESDPRIAVEHTDFNRDPWALNCLNGTVDLRTGELRPHRREDLITQLAPTNYDPNATCPLFDATLKTFLSTETANYLQRVLGYACTALTDEHILAIAWGSGSNGKSTILEMVMDVLGSDYSCVAAEGLLMARRFESHPTELADLFGKRLVVGIETDEGRRLNESRVKALTDGTPVKARRMHENFWEFQPTHTMVMATNHRPKVKGNDNGIWRRLKLVPFTITMPDDKADKAIPRKMRGLVEGHQSEQAGVLAWLVRGCMQWQLEGLTPPDVVIEATEDYREDQDTVGLFLKERTVAGGSSFKVKAGTLYACYKAWISNAGENPLSQRAFGEAITAKGYNKTKSNGIHYAGLALLEQSDSHSTEEIEEGTI